MSLAQAPYQPSVAIGGLAPKRQPTYLMSPRTFRSDAQ